MSLQISNQDDNIMKDVKYERMKKKKCLINLNIAAFIIFTLSFIALLILAIIFSPGSLETEITTDFLVYDVGAPPNFFSTQLESLGRYQLIWLELPFPFITAIFHALIAFYTPITKLYLSLTLQQGRNPIRWLEYSITASFMTWVILQISGVTNIFLLISVGVAMNIALQVQGHYMEILNTPKIVKEQKGKINWLPTIVGWIIFITQWAVIFSYFFSAILSPRPPTAEDVPAFVYTIIIGLFFQYSSFGLVQLFHFLGWPKFLVRNDNTEIAYVVLSIVSKLFLDWTLAIGILSNRM